MELNKLKPKKKAKLKSDIFMTSSKILGKFMTSKTYKIIATLLVLYAAYSVIFTTVYNILCIIDLF